MTEINKFKIDEFLENPRTKFYAEEFLNIETQIQESKELLEAMGIPVIQAPSEGEAEASVLARNGEVWAAASQDYDALLYGTPFLIRNLTLARRKKTASGLYIPDSAKEKPQQGKVVAVSKITSLKEGETVIYGKFTGTEVEIDGENFLILKESDIFAVIG